MILRDHDEAVWTLFNNEMATDGSQHFLFSGSASGHLIAFDLDRGMILLLASFSLIYRKDNPLPCSHGRGSYQSY